MRFILLRRRTDKTTIPTWVNIDNINTISTALDAGASRITLRDGFLICEEDVSAVMKKIKEVEHEG